MEKIKKYANIFIYLVVSLFLIIPVILEYLCKTKMSVYRYVIAKNIKLEKLIYPQFILFFKIIFIIIIISSMVIIIFNSEKSLKINLITIFILSIFGYIISIKKFNLQCYYYFLMAIAIDIILLYMQLFINKFNSK